MTAATELSFPLVIGVIGSIVSIVGLPLAIWQSIRSANASNAVKKTISDKSKLLIYLEILIKTNALESDLILIQNLIEFKKFNSAKKKVDRINSTIINIESSFRSIDSSADFRNFSFLKMKNNSSQMTISANNLLQNSKFEETCIPQIYAHISEIHADSGKLKAIIDAEKLKQ